MGKDLNPTWRSISTVSSLSSKNCIIMERMKKRWAGRPRSSDSWSSRDWSWRKQLGHQHQVSLLCCDHFIFSSYQGDQEERLRLETFQGTRQKSEEVPVKSIIAKDATACCNLGLTTNFIVWSSLKIFVVETLFWTPELNVKFHTGWFFHWYPP